MGQLGCLARLLGIPIGGAELLAVVVWHWAAPAAVLHRILVWLALLQMRRWAEKMTRIPLLLRLQTAHPVAGAAETQKDHLLMQDWTAQT